MATSIPLQTTARPGALRVPLRLLTAETSAQWQWGQQPPALAGCRRWATGYRTAADVSNRLIKCPSATFLLPSQWGSLESG